MRLFHVSENPNIKFFEPRVPERADLDKNVPLVWAISEKCLPNFLTPRNCPRVTYHVNSKTTKADINNFISSNNCKHVIIIENKWFEIMKNTTLYVYEFNTSNFILQDENAGYYVSMQKEIPVNKYVFNDLFEELFKRNTEVRVVDNLWYISEKIKKTSFSWSMCRMGYARRN